MVFLTYFDIYAEATELNLQQCIEWSYWAIIELFSLLPDVCSSCQGFNVLYSTACSANMTILLQQLFYICTRTYGCLCIEVDVRGKIPIDLKASSPFSRLIACSFHVYKYLFNCVLEERHIQRLLSWTRTVLLSQRLWALAQITGWAFCSQSLCVYVWQVFANLLVYVAST